MFEQNNRDVKRDQNNAANDINQYQHYYQPNNSVNERYKAGRDITNYQVGRDINTHHHKGASPASVLARGVTTLVVLLVVGVGIYLIYPSIQSLATKVFNGGLFNSDNMMARTLYGTPKNALDQFCNQLAAGNIQGAYDEYSDHLKSQNSADAFSNTWELNGETPISCVDTVIDTSGTSATGTLDTTYRTFNGTGTTDHHIERKITMVSSDGIWKIDALT